LAQFLEKETGEMNDFMLRISGKLVGVLALVLVLGLSARADDASAKLYQMKCVACHGADGVGNTTVGKALKITDFHDPDVQKESDADLTTIIAKGKNKMPSYEKTLKPDEIKGLVAYVRELAGKK
jgi:mono/diheme cytochrome c family protein